MITNCNQCINTLFFKEVGTTILWQVSHVLSASMLCFHVMGLKWLVEVSTRNITLYELNHSQAHRLCHA